MMSIPKNKLCLVLYTTTAKGQFYSKCRFKKSYSLPFDVVVTGRITTPFVVFAKSEIFEELFVRSVSTETMVSLETADGNVAEQLFKAFCPSIADSLSAVLTSVFDFPSFDSSAA